MIAIKDMEIPTDCKKCPFMGTDGNPEDPLAPMMCFAIWATTHEIKHCVGGTIRDDCPLVEIEEPKTEHCKDCKWWKDSDGMFRRGIDAESKCPMNHIEVYEGNGYCFMFEPQESEDKE